LKTTGLTHDFADGRGLPKMLFSKQQFHACLLRNKPNSNHRTLSIQMPLLWQILENCFIQGYFQTFKSSPTPLYLLSG